MLALSRQRIADVDPPPASPPSFLVEHLYDFDRYPLMPDTVELQVRVGSGWKATPQEIRSDWVQVLLIKPSRACVSSHILDPVYGMFKIQRTPQSAYFPISSKWSSEVETITTQVEHRSGRTETMPIPAWHQSGE